MPPARAHSTSAMPSVNDRVVVERGELQALLLLEQVASGGLRGVTASLIGVG